MFLGFKNYLVIASCILAGGLNAFADDRFDDIRVSIQEYLATSSVPSVAVAVAKDGNILWEEGFGWADVEKKIPATADTLYSLASISKPITTTGLMVLVERGLVDLDKPANEYLGDAKLIAHVGDANAATVRMLARHTSGLPLHYQFFYDDEEVKRPAMDESIRRYGHLMAAPGEVYQYANFGYGLLDYIISRTSGKSYKAFMEGEVFAPLGLKHSVIGRPSNFETGQIAQRYTPTGNKVPFYDFDHPGASAVYMSAHDLVRFGMFFLKNDLKGQKAIISHETIDSVMPVSEERYNIGWSRAEMNGYEVFGHTGGMAGVSTRLALIPELNAVVVVLFNQNAVGRAGLRLTPDILSLLSPSEEQQKTLVDTIEYRDVWRGFIETYQGKTPVELEIGEKGMRAKVGDADWQDAGEYSLDEDGFLELGYFDGKIESDDAGRYPYKISFKLKRREDVLNGYATAVSNRGMPDRIGNAQSYWTELRR